MEFPGIRIFQISVFLDYMDIRLPDMGLFACPMTQTRHGVCYLSRKTGRYPSESNKILIFYLTRRVLELTQQPQLFSENPKIKKSENPGIRRGRRQWAEPLELCPSERGSSEHSPSETGASEMDLSDRYLTGF